MYYLQYCENPSFEVVKFLIDLDSNTNPVSEFGINVLMYYAKYSKNPSLEFFKLFVESG